ncbi:GH12625 [Drosophila grimshawi]|uniref:GH12625 n=1 Tax=Drosophila grimshawi TaxID=7222 RepID=B4JKB0_DROGR|nr:GH12625 [Drosophila grimshawi]
MQHAVCVAVNSSNAGTVSPLTDADADDDDDYDEDEDENENAAWHHVERLLDHYGLNEHSNYSTTQLLSAPCNVSRNKESYRVPTRDENENVDEDEDENENENENENDDADEADGRREMKYVGGWV